MPSATQSPFGRTADGEQVHQFEITNEQLTVRLLDFGATLTEVHVPDRDGNKDNITLGHNSVEAWLANVPCFGGTCGRFANRIAGGRFQLDGQEYQLPQNHGENHLHGGNRGFHKRMWEGEAFSDDSVCGVRFSRVSSDGEEGYPGEMHVSVEYALPGDSTLRIRYSATTTKATPINLTNHAYWNLRGTSGGGVSVTDHELQLFCDQYLPVDASVIPTGEFRDVAGTVMDFRAPHAIGDQIQDVEGEGYDHCYVINGSRGELRPAAVAADPVSGRVMTVSTTEPGVQLYTGNFLSGNDETGGYSQHQGFCLETQTFPDAPNQPNFAPLGILRPGEEYSQTTVHRFSTR